MKNAILGPAKADSEAALRGKRLRFLRRMADLKRNALAEKLGVSNTTISYWENATHSGLNEKMADKIINVLANAGVECSANWLVEGVGQAPRLIAPALPSHLTNQTPSIGSLGRPIDFSQCPEALIESGQEIDLFVKLHRRAVVAQVTTANMQPFFDKGDTVGGIWLPSEFLTTEKFCIVELNGCLEARRVKPAAAPKTFDLCYASYANSAAGPFQLRDIALAEAAPIVRVWRNAP